MNTFYQVSHSLRADRSLGSLTAAALGIALLTAWVIWAMTARVTRYEVSDGARLQVNGSAYPVQTDVGGRVATSYLALGKEVHAGDVLVRVEDEGQQLNLEEERIHRATLAPQLAALRAQMQAENAGGADERRVLATSVEQARAQWKQAEGEAWLAASEAERARKLQQEGISAAAEADRATALARSKFEAAESLRAAVARLQPELDVRDREREVRVKQAAADAAKLEAEMAVSDEKIKQLEYERKRREVRAPATGRLGECAPLRSGGHVTEGEQIGVVLPDAALEIVADFSPAALGKLRAGQNAVFRLNGFPWAVYGTVPAQVSRVASEVRDGKVRVVLSVSPSFHSRIPLQHGLPGAVEVKVEQVSPMSLLLRSAGELTGAR